MSDRPGKSIGRRGSAAASPPSSGSAKGTSKAQPAAKAPSAKAPSAAHAPPGAKAAAKSAGRKDAAKAEKGSKRLVLPPHDSALLEALAGHTKLSPDEVIARALQSYAAAVAPGLRAPLGKQEQAGAEAGQRLFISVDGRPESEVTAPELVLGSGEGCDVRLELPLIAPRHARILQREGRFIFEDLRSPKGSYWHGALVDVRFLEDGDEIDLGGFLPIRFRIEARAGAV